MIFPNFFQNIREKENAGLTLSYFFHNWSKFEQNHAGITSQIYFSIVCQNLKEIMLDLLPLVIFLFFAKIMLDLPFVICSMFCQNLREKLLLLFFFFYFLVEIWGKKTLDLHMYPLWFFYFLPKFEKNHARLTPCDVFKFIPKLEKKNAGLTYPLWFFQFFCKNLRKIMLDLPIVMFSRFCQSFRRIILETFVILFFIFSQK